MAFQELQGSGFYPFLKIKAARDNPTTSKSDIWVGLGQDEDWVGDTPPPSNLTGLPNPIIYKRATIATVKEVVAGGPGIYSYTRGGVTKYFESIDESEVHTEGECDLLVACYFPEGVGGLSTFNFYSRAAFHNLTPATGHENDDVLLPADVSDVGNCIYLRNDDNPITCGDGNDPWVLIRF